MKRLFFIILSLGLCLNISAQTAREYIEQNPGRAANNMHSYEFEDVVDTPAPKGFKPFYITHYGRHGSRFEQSSTFAKAAVDGLTAAKQEGILTAKGQSLLSDITKIVDEHVGNEGVLTPRGAQEHRTLASRMAKRFPEVFSSKTRKQIEILSSTNPRSIISMANFTTSLKTAFPKIDYSYTCAPKYMYFIGPNFDYAKIGQMSASASSSQPKYDFSRLYSVLFTNQAKASEIIPNQESFVRAIYSAGSTCEDLDYLGIDIFRDYFTTDELVYLWQSGNDSIYLLWANSVELGDDVRNIIKPLLKDIVENADKAMAEGSDIAANLRFGHDTGVLPLFSLLGIDSPKGERYPFAKAHESWYTFKQIPMATNFQLIIYQNKKGEKLAKILYNEKEVTINGLKTVSGPYYDWNLLRNHFVNLYK